MMLMHIALGNYNLGLNCHLIDIIYYKKWSHQ